jgi:glycosyltransferase involved in cell wall biosynthesis
MELVALAAFVLLPFFAGIMVGWGLRSLVSLNRRERSIPKIRPMVEVSPSKPRWLISHASGVTTSESGAALGGADEAPLAISLVICTRNRAEMLKATLESIAAIRTDHHWEVLCIDNASTDNTASVIAAAGDWIRYYYEPRIGSGAARDTGWRQAKGEIVCYSDDDCYLAADYIDAMVAAFAERPLAGCIGGRILCYDATDAALAIDERTEPVRTPPYSFVFSGMFQSGNLAFRREALDQSGGYDPAFGAGTIYPCDDIDAAAAVLWTGYEAWFDPRPVVYHSGRKVSDMPFHVEDYDRGRGAFYAKFTGRRDTRLLFLRKWVTSPKHNPHYTFKSLGNEIGGAMRYARDFQGVLALARIALVGVGMFAVLSLSRPA